MFKKLVAKYKGGNDHPEDSNGTSSQPAPGRFARVMEKAKEKLNEFDLEEAKRKVRLLHRPALDFCMHRRVVQTLRYLRGTRVFPGCPCSSTGIASKFDMHGHDVHEIL